MAKDKTGLREIKEGDFPTFHPTLKNAHVASLPK